MVGLSDSLEDYERSGFTPEVQARAHAHFAEAYGACRSTSRVRPRMADRPCRRAAAVVAARLHAPAHEWRLLRGAARAAPPPAR